MSREKQIEEMDTILRRIFGCQFAYKISFEKYGGYGGHKEVYTKDIAKELTDAGYRKVDSVTFMGGIVEQLRAEVAEEIFAEIDKVVIRKIIRDGEVIYDVTNEYNELKKKYTESEKK